MDDTFLMSGLETLGDLSRQLQGFFNQNWASVDYLCQRHAFNQLHN